MFGSPAGTWTGEFYIDNHGCIVGQERWCEGRGRCIPATAACLMYTPGSPSAISGTIMPWEIENINIAKAQVRKEKEAQRGVPMNIPGNPQYQPNPQTTLLGTGQLATVLPNQQEVPRINMNTGEADQRVVFRKTSSVFYDQVLGVGQLAGINPPPEGRRVDNLMNPMYAPSIILDGRSETHDQVLGVGQFARITPPPVGRDQINLLAFGMNKPGQGARGVVNFRPWRAVHSRASRRSELPISPLVTKTTTVPIYAPGPG